MVHSNRSLHSNRGFDGYTQVFGRHIAKKYAQAVSKNLPEQVAGLFFDANSIFYRAAEIVYGTGDHPNQARVAIIENYTPEQLEQEHIDTIIALIEQAIVKIRPQQFVMIAVDGPVNPAKMSQQRSRRNLSKRGASESSPKGVQLGVERRKLFDTNAITPGTEFMYKLHIRLQLFINDVRARYGFAIEYSGYDIPGEGESRSLHGFVLITKSCPGHKLSLVSMPI